MKINRIHLKNFAGVKESEVCFASTGVTVVVGPNEIGKSSLFQALDLLLDHLDSSGHRDVNKSRPVHVGEGAEVEAELEVGQYRFTYSKRFHKNKETRLVIHSPQPESLVGRPAHSRVIQILDESMDATLWKALRIIQGDQIDLPDLRSQPALAQALNHAAGETTVMDGHEALFDAIHAEYARYWTEGGRAKQDPIGNAKEAAEISKSKFDSLNSDLTELEADIAKFRGLSLELDATHKSVAETTRTFEDLEKEWGAVSKLSDQVGLLEATNQAAIAEMNGAESAAGERTRMIDLAANQEEEIKRLSDDESQSKSLHKDASEVFAEVRKRRDQAKQAADTSTATLRLRRGDEQLRDNEIQHALLKERMERIHVAEKAASDAAVVVASSLISSEIRDGIRNAEINLKQTQAVLNAASPTVTVKTLQDVSITMNGEHLSVPLGESRTTTATEPIKLKISDIAEIDVAPGTGEAELQQDVTNAQQTLDDLCSQAGVADLEEAEKVLAILIAAERAIQERDSKISVELRDWTREKFESETQNTKSDVDAYLAGRSTTPVLPSDLEEARQWLSEAEVSDIECGQVLSKTLIEYESAQSVFDDLGTKSAVAEALAKQVREDSARAAGQLQVARNSVSDDDVTLKYENSTKALNASSALLTTGKQKLSEAHPEIVEERLDTSHSAKLVAEKLLNSIQTNLVSLQARLDALGGQGLGESVSYAEKASIDAADILSRLLRRSQTSELLYKTFTAERDEAQSRYVAPLRDRIQSLGKYVFNDTFRVEVDDQLRVVTRTMDGRTLPFASLSTGTREQIGLLMRLGTAILADGSGGVPLVLDDTLGSTDRERLIGTGVAISIAARSCQIILLTSIPERYQHIKDAEIVMLE